MRRLRLNLSVGLPGIQAEHLCQWLHEVTRDKATDTTNLQKVITIVKVSFCNGALADDSTWKTVVLIHKGGIRDFRGIFLVEVLWKTFTILMNPRFTADITFHDVMHGFQAGRGTGTTSLEAKLL